MIILKLFEFNRLVTEDKKLDNKDPFLIQKIEKEMEIQNDERIELVVI